MTHACQAGLSCTEGQRRRGDVHGCHPPTLPGQPDGVVALPATEVEPVTGSQAAHLSHQQLVGVAARAAFAAA